jgi:hypothetical protein
MDQEGAGIMAQYLLSGIIAFLAAIMTVLLTMILGRLNRLEEKLDVKQDKAFCENQKETCDRQFSTKEFWEAFGKHSHTGLAATSKVTR